MKRMTNRDWRRLVIARDEVYYADRKFWNWACREAQKSLGPPRGEHSYWVDVTYISGCLCMTAWDGRHRTAKTTARK